MRHLDFFQPIIVVVQRFVELLHIDLDFGVDLDGGFLRQVTVVQRLHAMLQRQRGGDTDHDHQIFAAEFLEGLGLGDFKMHASSLFLQFGL